MQRTNSDGIEQGGFRIEAIRRATVNGRPKLIFSAYKRSGDAFVFAGQFSAPPRTPRRDLWRVAEQAIAEQEAA